jgi:hypothetical protein
MGESCTDIACPNCLLTIPRDLLEIPPTFLSILGAPSSGKSYFLATSIWQVRKILSSRFHLSLEDSDPSSNRKLQEYEELLFLSRDPNVPVALPKTEPEGDLYQQVMIRDQLQSLARPFVFRIRALPTHSRASEPIKLTKAVCLYDNAGEHFQPGLDSSSRPGTRHLAVSKAILYLFDPTQHLAIRQICEKRSQDPQMLGLSDHQSLKTLVRQDLILTEAARRISQITPGSQHDRDKRPLIVVVTKFDAWMKSFGEQLDPDRLVAKTADGGFALNIKRISRVSEKIRSLLKDKVPEIVSTAEAFSSDVTYLPVSALGTSPELGEVQEDGKRPLLIRPKDIRPIMIEIPLLYVLYRTIPGIIPRVTDGDS